MKTAIICIVAILGGWMTAPAGQAQEAEAQRLVVSLSESAKLPGLDVRLSDIARVTGGSDEERAQLGQTILGLAPPPGERIEISHAFVLDQIARRGWDRSRVLVTGADLTRATPDVRPVSGEELLRKGRQALHGVLERRPTTLRIEIEPGSPPPGPLVPVGRRGIEVEYRTRTAHPETGHAYVDAAILVDGRPYRTIPLSYRVRVYGNVVAATRAIGRDEPLGPDNVALVEREIPRVAAGNTLTSLAATVDRLARRAIRPGEILTVHAMYRPYAVRRGDAVILVLHDGALTLTTKGIAASNGYRGQAIPVTNSRSGRIVHGRIRDGKTVEVEPVGRRAKKGTQP